VSARRVAAGGWSGPDYRRAGRQDARLIEKFRATGWPVREHLRLVSNTAALHPEEHCRAACCPRRTGRRFCVWAWNEKFVGASFNAVSGFRLRELVSVANDFGHQDISLRKTSRSVLMGRDAWKAPSGARGNRASANSAMAAEFSNQSGVGRNFFRY
jgi:hypothetical protein